MNALSVWIIVAFGVIAILKRGRWTWRVTNSVVLTVLFWCGWFSALIIGLISLLMLWQGGTMNTPMYFLSDSIFYVLVGLIAAIITCVFLRKGDKA